VRRSGAILSHKLRNDFAIMTIPPFLIGPDVHYRVYQQAGRTFYTGGHHLFSFRQSAAFRSFQQKNHHRRDRDDKFEPNKVDRDRMSLRDPMGRRIVTLNPQ
jgi:hypothetical protein